MRSVYPRYSRRAACTALSVLGAVALVTGSPPTARAETIFGFTNSFFPSLVSFDSATPGTVSTIGPVIGMTAGHTLRAIDFRPSNGLLYAISVLDATNVTQLYTMDLSSAALTAVGSSLTVAPGSPGSPLISMDFDPVADALRVVTENNLNYRINADTGALISRDTDINIAARHTVISGIAYSNNVVGAASTTLYAFNRGTGGFGTIGSVGGTPISPNTGTYTNINTDDISPANTFGFDISGATGIAYISLNVGQGIGLYTANLATGALTLSGSIAGGVTDLSVRPAAVGIVPEPGTALLLASGVLPLVGMALRKRQCNRRAGAAS